MQHNGRQTWLRTDRPIQIRKGMQADRNERVEGSIGPLLPHPKKNTKHKKKHKQKKEYGNILTKQSI